MPLTTPADGRITSLTELTGVLTGSALMYIVSPGSAQLGNSYKIQLNTLGAFFGAYSFSNPTVITLGATYPVLTSDTRILVNKTIGSATSIVFPTAASMLYPYGVLVKDLKGDADSNPITITFTSGELCDGLSSIALSNPYAWTTINPKPGGGAWYMT